MSKFIKKMFDKLFPKSEIGKIEERELSLEERLKLSGIEIEEDINEPIEETLARFINKGVHQTKIITTTSPSVVIWSKTRKCLVGGKGQPDSFEVIDDGNGNLRATCENNLPVSLQVRTELTESDVKEINESEGIIATNATYGKPYFRYGFIPN